ncbi:MAG TPA: carbonic anhydrase [Blastocatellia bacterium]|nr:carbonic anhydrase [Blastocatellia bacterium]
MKQNTRWLVRKCCVVVATLLLVFPGYAVDKPADKPTVPATEALARLKAGNARFVKGQRAPVNYITERHKLVAGQQPYAIVLSCSDSRVPPELVFDESLGRVFVIRVAGNVTDPEDLGSIEYAAEHLHSKLLVVLGHESCGAVKATLDGGKVSPNLEAIIRKIEPAAKRARQRGLDPEATLRLAVSENVREQMDNALKESEVLKEMVEKKDLTVLGAVYHLGSGKVEWLGHGLATGK